MLWRPGLQSYAVQMVKGKVILFVLLSFFAAKGHLVAASSASRGLPLNASFQISVQLSQTPWSEDFFNNKSAMFVALATNLTTAVSDVIKTVGNGTVEVVEFRPGSVIAVMKVTASSLHEKAMKAKLESEMKDGVLGGFSVDQTLYSGTIFDVILKVKFSCNDSLPDKGFIQKEELVNAISSGLSGNHEVLNASIHGIECSEADNITMVTARVQINDPLAANPYKELSGLKSQIDSSKLGSFSVVPEWKSYIPGEKVFYVRVSLNTGSTNTTQTRQQLKQFIEDDFKGDSKFRYVHVIMPDNTSAIIEIGMRSSTSPILSLALTPIRQDLGNGKLGNVLLNKGLNRVTIDMKSLTRKIFEVSFIKYVSSCVDADVANPSSSHYKELSQKFTQFIDTNMKAHQLNSQFYLSTEVIKLKCENSTSVEGYSYVYMKPSTEDKIANLNGALYKCNTEPGIFDNGLTISLRTPTTPDAKGRWSSTLDGVSLTRGSCLKPKPPDPTNPSPTAPPTTTEPPTQVSTTDNRTTAPTTENQTITPGFSSTKPQTITTIKPVVTSETTTSPTTKVVLPTLPKEPELYVKVKLGLTWGEFCSIQHVFKERIAWNVRDQNDTRVSPDRIIYVNVERNCADPSKNDELADVWFYLSKPGSQEADESLTSKAYELFKMFFENGNTRQLGPYFEEKVLQIELAGNKASRYEKETGIMMPSWLIILLAVAGAVGLFLMLLACCCLFCCGATRRRRKRKYDPEQPQVLKVVHVDSNGSVIRGSGQKNGKENNQVIDTKKEQAGDGKHIKDDGDKDGYNNGGFESDNNNKSPDGKQNCAALEGQEGKSPKAGHETKALNGSSENTYQSLNKTDDLGDHSYASVNKPGSTTEGKGNDDKSNNATHAAMMAPVTGGGSKGSGSGGGKNKNGGSSDFNSSRATNIEDNVRYVTTTAPVTSGGIKGSGASDSKSNSDGSQPDVNSSRAGNNGNSQDSQSGSKASPTSFTKTDVSPKGDERRGSRARSFVEEDVPLTHKTGTVGIVALAIRNKNETKKEREFKNLDKDIPNEEVKYPPDTTSKNRYSDALPAPRTRVKLSTSPDYINANWIRDHKGQACYIATQHPLQATAGDFWRMVWDQKAHTVVMVNNEEKEKPAEFMDYLPKGEGNTKQFGGFDVTIKQIIEKPDYVLTVLSIAEGKNTASSREVSYMKFTSWKERVMPNVALFVGFVSATREARKKYGDTKAPTIVHCSDGLGFTGVYIAVDIGIKSHEESKNSVVDVFEMSKNLRRDRHGIVSTLEHYNFIYQALYEYTVNYNKLAE